MGNGVQSLIQQFTDKRTVAECSVDELQQVVSRYPYFAPARFALLQKLREGGDEAEYAIQYQKAVLYYPDPLQFNHFINAFDYGFDSASLTTVFDSIPPSVESNVEVVEEPQSVVLDKETDHTTGFAPAQMLVEPPAAEAVVTTEQSEDGLVSSSEAASVDEAHADKTHHTEPAPSKPLLNSADESPAEALAFEPYHTVDYFASQGIKVSAEDLTKDKLGKQLRSFTEWLKTMKRLPSAGAAQPTSIAAEQNVESLAGASVSEKEVVTEAMAEVWAKQGDTEKAASTYQKLSLLNPAKAAYFAAKIQALKQPI